MGKKDARHDRVCRVGTFLKDVESAVLGTNRDPHGLLQRFRDPPLAPHEVDPAAEFNLPGYVSRQEQAQDLLVRNGTEAVATLCDEPLRPHVGDLAGLLVRVRPVPERDMLAREDIGPCLVVHASRLERDDDPMLKRAHRPFDLTLRLRRRGYHVVDAEGPAHAPELGAEVLALVSEKRESVRVERLRHAVAQERGLEHRVVLEQVLALADSMCRDLARGVVKREDDALIHAVGSPDVSWRRVVLVYLAVGLGLPATVVVVRLLALDRERAAHERHEVLLAELPHARAVAHEIVLAHQFVGIELEVRTVVLRRLDERLQLLDARRWPG